LAPLDETEGHAAGPLVDEALALELSRRGEFEVVRAAAAARAGALAAELRRTGRQSAAALIDAGRRSGVDAVLSTTVDAFDAYDPPLVSFRASLVSTETGEVLWGAAGVFDAREPSTADAARELEGGGGPTAATASIRRFVRFACAELVATLPGPLGPREP
ncbi:MAG TPA: hypothetical protein VHF22_06015, partial [Planctomycetota bacterium]|nr:hypothetical protein [Planctomycetota bacterium]